MDCGAARSPEETHKSGRVRKNPAG